MTFCLSPRLFASKFSEEKLWFSALARAKFLLPKEKKRDRAPKVLTPEGEEEGRAPKVLKNRD